MGLIFKVSAAPPYPNHTFVGLPFGCWSQCSSCNLSILCINNLRWKQTQSEANKAEGMLDICTSTNFMDQKRDILVLYAEHFMSDDVDLTNKNIWNISYMIKSMVLFNTNITTYLTCGVNLTHNPNEDWSSICWQRILEMMI